MPVRRRLLIALLTAVLASCSAPVAGQAIRGDSAASAAASPAPGPAQVSPAGSAPGSTPTPTAVPTGTAEAPASSPAGSRTAPSVAPTAGQPTPTDSSPADLPTGGETSAPATRTASSASSPPTTNPPSSPPATPTTTSRPTTRSTGPTTIPVGAGFPLCPAVPVTDSPGTVACIRASVSQFWSGELNQVVDQAVVIDPVAGRVPAACRPALTSELAFTCQVNDTVYLTPLLLSQLTKEFPAGEVPYALSTIVGHEIGHVVQAAVKQPGYTDTTGSQAISQRIEQQADCLAGVWAHSAVADGRLGSATFVRVSRTFLTGISSNPEIYTHGTPDQRMAALGRGLRAGRPQDCGLATFS